MTDVLIHLEDAVLTFTLNREHKKNAFTQAMYTELADALRAAQDNPAVRVVIVQGHETFFSAGNDLADFLQAEGFGMDSPVIDFLQTLSSFKKPVIASVCGPAVGIGSSLLLHCDLVVAGDNAAFSLPFVNLGLCPEAASSLLLPQLMGYHRAAQALLLGEPFMAEAALEVGWVNQVVVPSEANVVAKAWALKLAAKPPSAVMQTKALMKAPQALAIKAVMEQEAMVFARMLKEGPAKEAFSAFLEHRKPDFFKHG